MEQRARRQWRRWPGHVETRLKLIDFTTDLLVRRSDEHAAELRGLTVGKKRSVEL